MVLWRGGVERGEQEVWIEGRDGGKKKNRGKRKHDEEDKK